MCIYSREDEEAEMKYLKPDLHFNRMCLELEIISEANFKFASVAHSEFKVFGLHF
jgi:hypothetical protein